MTDFFIMKKSAADHSKKKINRDLCASFRLGSNILPTGSVVPWSLRFATLLLCRGLNPRRLRPTRSLKHSRMDCPKMLKSQMNLERNLRKTQESTGPSNLAVQEQQKDGKLSGANPEDSKAAGATPEENSQIADGQAAAPSCQENSQIADGQEEAAVKAEDKEENEMSLEQLALVKATEAEDPLLGELAAAATGALVRQNAFVDDEDDINEFSCKKCGLSIMAEECVVKGPTRALV